MRRAFDRNPASAALRLQLVTLLNHQDAFDDTIAVLTRRDGAPLGYRELIMLTTAYLARETVADTACAIDTAERAAAVAESDAQRSVALSEQARAVLRGDSADTAVPLLETALQLNPHNKEACKRLAVQLLRRGDAAAVVALTDRLVAQGVGHARILISRMTALAMLGRIPEARDTLALSDFRYQGQLATPTGWESLQAFNAALIDELMIHPGMRYGRYGTASHDSWRIDALATGAAPVARQLLDGIIAAANAHLDALPDQAHPWLTARPKAGLLKCWCVITEGDGYEAWHVHPHAWMSGVYYAQVPEAVTAGSDLGGCIVFGLPEGLVGAEAAQAFGEDVVRPQAGMLMLFPSHSYHRTFPHGSADRRVCVAFDIWSG